MINVNLSGQHFKMPLCLVSRLYIKDLRNMPLSLLMLKIESPLLYVLVVVIVNRPNCSHISVLLGEFW